MKPKNIIFLLILGILAACEPKIDDFKTTSGDADFSRYVAIGNSLTAGLADAELYRSGQLNSFPNILAEQFKAAGGGEFTQPLMFDEYGFGNRLLLDAALPGPVPAGITPSEKNFESIAANGPFQNLGVPAIKSYQLGPGAESYSLLNPYFKRFATDPGVSTVLSEATQQGFSFFTCWIGSNDVLAYALEGGASDIITDGSVFNTALENILNTMVTNGAKGAIANIPDILNIPFFTFMNTQVPYNALVLEQAQADALNAAYAPLNQIIIGAGSTDTLAFAAGYNPFVIEDHDLPWGIRQMKSAELFLMTLPTDSVQNYGYGSQIPIPDKYVLTNAEIENIIIATGAFNETIIYLKKQYKLAFVDFYAKLKEVETGITYDGITFTTQFIYGNTFSLDGIHLTAQGYAMVANFFIEAINAEYNSQLTEVSPMLYPGIYYYQ